MIPNARHSCPGGAHHRQRPVSATMIEGDCWRQGGHGGHLCMPGGQASPHARQQPRVGRLDTARGANSYWQLCGTWIAWPRLIEVNISGFFCIFFFQIEPLKENIYNIAIQKELNEN